MIFQYTEFVEERITFNIIVLNGVNAKIALVLQGALEAI